MKILCFNKMKKKSGNIIDLCFSALLGILVGICLYRHFVYNLIFNVRNYLAFLSLVLLTVFLISKPNSKKNFLFWLLVLSTFQLTDFSIGTSIFSMGIKDGNSLSIWFDPIVFILLVSYSLICRDMVVGMIRNFFSGSEQDQEEEKQKLIKFYYDKFIGLDTNQLAEIYKNYNEYPVEAQISLAKIKKEAND